MSTVPRPTTKTSKPRERTATPAELAEDTRRSREAREAHRVLAPAPAEGNLCACLVLLARFRKCSVCARPVLYVNEQARTDGDVECPACIQVRTDLAKRLRFVKLASRVRSHLTDLFSTANDNASVAS